MTGADVKQVMADLDLTEQRIAEHLGVTCETVDRWVNDLDPIPQIAAITIVALHLDAQEWMRQKHKGGVKRRLWKAARQS